MCDRCAALEEEVAYLKSELGLTRDAEAIDRLRIALRTSLGSSSNAGTASRLVAILYAAGGRAVGKWALMEQIPPKHGCDDDRDSKIIDVWVCLARKSLGKDAIGTIYGRGYFLTPAGLARVKEIVSPEGIAA